MSLTNHNFIVSDRKLFRDIVAYTVHPVGQLRIGFLVDFATATFQ